MVEIARKYHEEAQEDVAAEQTGREEAIVDALETLDAQLSNEQREELGRKLTYEDITDALSKMPNGKAAGLDGIPTELWKTLHRTYQEQSRKSDGASPEPFDIISLIQQVFNDIEENGVQPGSGFAE
ncbi:hypothetical protein DFP72DRAFT_773733, partial [Ephemerocybe angulata]